MKRDDKNDIIYGFHVLTHLLQIKPEAVLEIFMQADRVDQRTQKIQDLAQKWGIALKRLDKKKFDQLWPEVSHQAVVAKIRPQPIYSENDLTDLIQNPKNVNGDLKKTPPLVLVLDGIQDPHNLGACLRTSDASGVTAVIIPKDRSASVSGVVRKVASGAAETIPVVQVTNLVRSLEQLKELGLWIVGTSAEAKQSIYQIDLKGPIAIVLGAEGSGMRLLTGQHCDMLAHIPMRGIIESLNVSVAAGVCLYEALRQRGV